MKAFPSTALSQALCAALPPESGTAGRPSPAMVILHSGAQPASAGPAQYFTGAVRVEMLTQPEAPSRVSSARVTFQPGARTAWHRHPLGQTLVVLEGSGWVQQEGGEKQPVHPGDVIWTPPGIKHWHGATATTAMSHVAIQEAQDGNTVEWLEQVSDIQYGQ